MGLHWTGWGWENGNLFHTHQLSYLAWSHVIIELSLRFLLVLTFTGGFICAKHRCQLLSWFNSFDPQNNDIDRWPHYPPFFTETEVQRSPVSTQDPSATKWKSYTPNPQSDLRGCAPSSKWDSAPWANRTCHPHLWADSSSISPPPQQSLLTPS